MNQDTTWTCGWGVTLTDYSRIRLHAHHYRQKIQIINNSEGTALKLQFSHVYGREKLIFQKVSLRINDGEEILVTKDRKEKIVLEACSASYSDEIKAALLPQDKITIEAVFGEDVPIADASLIPDTELLQIATSGELICRESDEYIRELNTIPDVLHWLIGICGIEVCTEKTVDMIAFFGDSLLQVPYWISPLMRECYRQYPGKLTYKNAGISGNRLLYGTAALPKSIGNINGDAGIKRMEHDIFSGQIPKWVVILEGINDLILPFEYRKLDEIVKSEELITGLKRCVELCERYGSKPILCTLLPFKGHFCWNGISETVRQEVNQWIREQKAIAYLDTDVYAADKEDPRCLKAEWREEGDNLHLNLFGGNGLAKEILSSEVMKSILHELGTF